MACATKYFRHTEKACPYNEGSHIEEQASPEGEVVIDGGNLPTDRQGITGWGGRL